jgi:hypothetical protein
MSRPPPKSVEGSGGGHGPHGDDLLAHVAPLGWEHITFNGDYIWPTEPLEYSFRPLRDPRSSILDAA